MRRIGRVALIALCAIALLGIGMVVAAPAGAANVVPSAETDFVARTNELRASQGLAPLQVDDDLTAKARDWAQTMADAGRIFHSNLPDNVHRDWHRLGENVGSGPDVASIHDALVKSPKHLANLVDPGFRFVGVGVVNADGTIFVSEVFMELASQPAPSTSAPAAGTPPSSDDTPGPASAPLGTPRAGTEPLPSSITTPVAAAPAAATPPGPSVPSSGDPATARNAQQLDAALARLRRVER